MFVAPTAVQIVARRQVARDELLGDAGEERMTSLSLEIDITQTIRVGLLASSNRGSCALPPGECRNDPRRSRT